MRLLGPNTIGLINFTDNIVLSASGSLDADTIKPGGISLVSQSGGILGSLLSRGAAEGIGFSKLVATGNEADLDLADIIDYLSDDPDTSVIALYMETLRNPTRFKEAASKAAAAGKPVLALKAGRSTAGARAVASHTGAMAGSDQRYDALFESVGVTRVHRLTELLNTSKIFAAGRRLSGNRIAVLTSTGGAATLVVDSLEQAGLSLPLPEETLSRQLHEVRSDDGATLTGNPIDVTLAGVQRESLQRYIKAIVESPCYDALVVVVGSSSLSQPDLLCDAIGENLQHTAKPIVAYVSPHAPSIGRALAARGIPAFSTPENCADALRALAAHHQHKLPVPQKIREITIPPLPSGALDEVQARTLFDLFGIRGVREKVIDTDDAAAATAQDPTFGTHVVLKVLSEQILHKTEAGAVALNVPVADLATHMNHMRDTVRKRTGVEAERFLVQEYLSDGIELMLGLNRDELGTTLMVGAGGVDTELNADFTLMLLSSSHGLAREDAHRLLRRLRCYPLLTGYRNQPPADIEAIIDTIIAFAEMGVLLGDRLITAEINPLVVLANEKKVRAVDALAVLKNI